MGSQPVVPLEYFEGRDQHPRLLWRLIGALVLCYATLRCLQTIALFASQMSGTIGISGGLFGELNRLFEMSGAIVIGIAAAGCFRMRKWVRPVAIVGALILVASGILQLVLDWFGGARLPFQQPSYLAYRSLSIFQGVLVPVFFVFVVWKVPMPRELLGRIES